MNKKNNEQSQNEYKIIDLTKEYAGYEGEEKWAIVSELTADELAKKYPELIKEHSPYVLLSVAQGQVIDEFKRNEMAYLKKNERYEVSYVYEEGLSESVYPELRISDCLEVIEEQETNGRIKEALISSFAQLTPAQQRRAFAHFFLGKSSRTIGKEEGVYYSVVDKSINGAVKRMKKAFETCGLL